MSRIDWLVVVLLMALVIILAMVPRSNAQDASPAWVPISHRLQATQDLSLWSFTFRWAKSLGLSDQIASGIASGRTQEDEISRTDAAMDAVRQALGPAIFDSIAANYGVRLTPKEGQ